MKVETYLRMVGLPYEVINGVLPFKAPKKKLPYIEDGTQIIADSGFILKYFKQTYGDKLDENLSDHEKASAHALSRLFEENLYWSSCIAGGSRSQFTWKHGGCFLAPFHRS